MPDTARTDRSEDRRRAILKAAREVFIEAGFDGARVAEIGRRAGIAEGTVYIYYKTKSALMEALLAGFWQDLTRNARETVARHSDPLEQLHALADYHLTSVIRDLAFLDLAAKLRKAYSVDPETRDFLRAYVAVFDEIYAAGVAAGLFRAGQPAWIARDMFYGTLEYSARTIALRGDTRPTGVVDNLIQAFKSTYGAKPALDETLVSRLEAAISQLEKRA
ncbi:TetR/AcrR family transcriptional regulator [Hyphobacterium sp. HN65]|uniref:TetR/AcrR family transcriptional regulator n=1 Tax=Hyphobacterium lacteum TaxID=3116575 RepID=A0ABU7LT20_9PROT|nr:TetR/AcrR family transcriptional regulator [Hyphobacterium sp. HN65]MEE2526786.1 TetR/AcrR family transcriptional regulator [Hyphobacterium sp. HN65]